MILLTLQIAEFLKTQFEAFSLSKIINKMKKILYFSLISMLLLSDNCQSQTPPARSKVRREVEAYRQSAQTAADSFLNPRLSEATRLAVIAPHPFVYTDEQAIAFRRIVANNKESPRIRAAALGRLYNYLPKDRELEALTFGFLRNKKDDPLLRQAAFGALKALSFSKFSTVDAQDDIKDILRSLTDDANIEFRRYALENLVARGDDAARQLLISGAESASGTPLNVVDCLKTLSFDNKPANFQPTAYKVFQRNDDRQVRLTAIRLLGGYKPAEAPLSILLADPKSDPNERRAALGALYAGNRSSILMLATGLLKNEADKDDDLKAIAVQMAMYYRQSAEQRRKSTAIEFDRILNQLVNNSLLADTSVLKQASQRYLDVVKPKF